MNITPEWISAAASSVTAIGLVFAFWQLRVTKVIAQLQFEDGLAKEYRELANKIPTDALLGQELDEEGYRKTFDDFYRYIDLSNEQVSLRQRDRVSEDVWKNWSEGIQTNLSLPAFNKAWTDIKARSNSFQELRRLEAENYLVDPRRWKQPIFIERVGLP